MQNFPGFVFRAGTGLAARRKLPYLNAAERAATSARVVLSLPITSPANQTGSTPGSPQRNSIFLCFHPSPCPGFLSVLSVTAVHAAVFLRFFSAFPP
jgi:hypothetical protein